MHNRPHPRLLLTRRLGGRISTRAFLLCLAVAAAAGLAFLGGWASGGRDVTVFLALAPSTEDASTSHPGATYPAGTRLAHLRLDTPGEVPQVIPGWTLAAPAAVSYDGNRLLFAGRQEGAPFDQIWELRVGGRYPRQVIRVGVHCATPFYLPNGRIVFGMEVEGEPRPVYSLFTSALDGSDLDRITYGRSVDRVMAILDDGRVLFERTRWGAKADPEADEGQVMAVFPDGTGIAAYGASLPERPSLAIGPVAASRSTRAWEGEAFYAASLFSRDPLRLTDGTEGFHAFDPVAAAPRARPRVATSVVDGSRSSGWLLCLNAYRSRLPQVSEAAPGSLQRVRVWDSLDNALLGEAPIEEDGSFFLEVPANRLLSLELADAEGKAVGTLESGIWVRPNEHRGCVGCHQPSYWAAENRPLQALDKPPVPVGVTPSPLYSQRGSEDPSDE